MGLYNDAEFYEIVYSLQYYLSPFGYIALSFMIAAMESVRSANRTVLYNLGFLISGILIAGLFYQGAFTLVWSGNEWISIFSLEFEIGRAILVVLTLISAGPLALRIFHRLNISVRNDIPTRVSFWMIVTVLPILVVLQPFKLSLPEFIQPLLHQSVILAIVSTFFLMLVFLFRKHPTILFVATHEIDEIYIIKRGSGLPLYHYNFVFENDSNDSGLLSAFFTSIRHYVKHSLGSGNIERIHVGDYEMYLHEGIFTYGLLLAKESTSLAMNLLALSVTEFEAQYGFELEDYVEPKKYSSFDDVVSRYFEFAIETNKPRGATLLG
ncbi:MAG: hypothetical protein ACTSUO_09560 [Candidatus Thorarchaeota archaeon]